APSSRKRTRFGVCAPSSEGVRPTTSRTSVRCTSVFSRRLAAKHAVSFPELRLIDAERSLELGGIEPPALGEERDGVPPAHGFDGGERNACLGEGLRR